MGGDISVFNENELEYDFWKYHGPKDESTLNLVKRSWKGFSDRVKHKRMTYTREDLTNGVLYGGENIFFSEVNIEGNIKGGFWSDCSINDSFGKICVLYMHTNTRCLSDSLEILPLCEGLKILLIIIKYM